jgi:hypothetical protein
MNTATLSREEIRRNKAMAQKLRHANQVAKEKAWLDAHPEVSEAREREKKAEAEKRHQLWLESENKRKLLSQQATKKKPVNAFSALCEESEEEIEEKELVVEDLTDTFPQLSDTLLSTPCPAQIENAWARDVIKIGKGKMSWADMMDESDEETA